MIDKLEHRFTEIDPRTRRRAAIYLLVGSFVLGHANVGAYVLGFISHGFMDTVTNYLSWLAFTITALDILFTSDVRVQQDDE